MYTAYRWHKCLHNIAMWLERRYDNGYLVFWASEQNVGWVTVDGVEWIPFRLMTTRAPPVFITKRQRMVGQPPIFQLQLRQFLFSLLFMSDLCSQHFLKSCSSSTSWALFSFFRGSLNSSPWLDKYAGIIFTASLKQFQLLSCLQVIFLLMKCPQTSGEKKINTVWSICYRTNAE